MKFYQDKFVTLYHGDCRSMAELASESIQMVVTSPPYWGLRKYAGLPDLIWGGNKDCEHEWDETIRTGEIYDTKTGGSGSAVRQAGVVSKVSIPHSTCSLCGAWKGAYGLEPTPEMYVQHTIEILQEIRRVSRKDGVVFWNIGDSYCSGKSRYSSKPQSISGGKDRGDNFKGKPDQYYHPYLKDKDLCLIPLRVAIAAQMDGWWVRSVIIWSKPNPMPESVRDRPTESHEYILMLTKSARYYWDAEAVRRPFAANTFERSKYPTGMTGKSIEGRKIDGRPQRENTLNVLEQGGANLRSVWTFPTQPYPEAHFATYPEKLVEICVKAATPEVGCCSKCGKPWERIVEKGYPPEGLYTNHTLPDDGLVHTGIRKGGVFKGSGQKVQDWLNEHPAQTLGWQPQCKCSADKVPSIVLDPFVGSGTTLWVAKKLGRYAIGYELSEQYCKLAQERNKQGVMI